jgi:amino acid adenylation domain-containing protein
VKQPEFLLYDVLRNCAGLSDKVAIHFGDQDYSYRQIDDLSDRLSKSLQKKGVHKGNRVVVCLGNSIETIIAFWAVLKAGGVVVNVGSEITAANLSYVLKDSEATVLLTENKKIKELGGVADGYPFIQSILVADAVPAVDNATTFQDALSQSDDSIKKNHIIDLDLAAIIYTSGSTGKPKGVMLTHRNMLSALRSLESYLNYTAEDVVLCSLPLSFDYGLYQMLMSMRVGAKLVLEREFTWPIFLIKSINQHEVTVIPFVPTMLMLLNAYADRKNMQFPSVRAVTNTGAALKENHIAMMRILFPEAKIFSMYGLTECKRCTYLPPEDMDRKPDSIGIPIPNTELWLVDEHGDVITEPNTVGQLVIRGSTVMAGYWRKPEATAKRLKPGPTPDEKVLYTGDYCSLDEEGYLYFKGRIDHVIKSRGMKVSPNEVESFLHTVSGVEAATVVGIEDQERGEALFAFVQPSLNVGLHVSEILDLCRKHLEPYKVPEYISILKTLPRTANGKYDVLTLGRLAQQELMPVAY